MRTARGFANRYEFRSEFTESYDSEYFGFGIDIQPIDAPEVISAGYSHRITLSNKRECNVAAGVVRGCSRF